MTTTAIIDQALTDAQQAQKALTFLRAQTAETAMANWEFLWEEKRYADAARWYRAMVVPTREGVRND